MWLGFCRLPTADCRLPTADCRLPTADFFFDLPQSTAVFGMKHPAGM
jgi:hypothetical protein